MRIYEEYKEWRKQGFGAEALNGLPDLCAFAKAMGEFDPVRLVSKIGEYFAAPSFEESLIVFAYTGNHRVVIDRETPSQLLATALAEPGSFITSAVETFARFTDGMELKEPRLVAVMERYQRGPALPVIEHRSYLIASKDDSYHMCANKGRVAVTPLGGLVGDYRRSGVSPNSLISSMATSTADGWAGTQPFFYVKG